MTRFISVPPEWRIVPLRSLLAERDERNRPDRDVLSVYRDLGVVPKEEREDNFNRTPEDLSNYKAVHRGDLVINKMKAWQGSIALSAFDGIVSGDYLVCRVTGEVQPRFLHHALRGKPYIAEIGSLSTGIRPAQWRLYWDDLKAMHIALPSMREQVATADFLDRETARIDQLMDRRQSLVGLLWSRWESEVYRAVTKGLDAKARPVGSGLEWAGDIPAHWTTPPVYANFDIQLGKMLNPERAAGPSPSPYLRNVNVQWDRIDLDDLAAMNFDAADRVRYALRAGDLLVCEGGEVGRAAIWRGDLDECYYQKAVHRVRPRGNSNPRFLMYALWAAASMNVFNVEGNQATIAHLTAEKLRAHRFPMPPRPEQDAIVKHLDRGQEVLRTLTERIDRQIDRLKEHRQALITGTVTGRTEVPPPAA